MLRSSSVFTRQGCRAGLIVAAVAAPGVVAAPAFATCADFQSYRQERRSLVEQFQELVRKDKKVQPKDACAVLSKFVTNSATTIEWMETNKDSCQIPDQFLATFKSDHDRAAKLRRQACAAAIKQDDIDKLRRRMQPPVQPLIIAGS
jgi:hypothetical protein